MATSIQIHEMVKQELDFLKQERESYEDVIVRLIDNTEIKKRKDKQLLIKGYKEMANYSLKVTKEWEKAEFEWG